MQYLLTLIFLLLSGISFGQKISDYQDQSFRVATPTIPAEAVNLGYLSSLETAGIASYATAPIGVPLLLGSATGTHEIFLQASNSGSYPFACSKFFSIWVATTTELLGSVITSSKFIPISTWWDVSIATSSTRGSIILSASCTAPFGATWTLKIYRNTR